jgi:hypothetical protein
LVTANGLLDDLGHGFDHGGYHVLLPERPRPEDAFQHLTDWPAIFIVFQDRVLAHCLTKDKIKESVSEDSHLTINQIQLVLELSTKRLPSLEILARK